MPIFFVIKGDMANPLEQRMYPELPRPPEMVVKTVDSTIVHSGIAFDNFEEAWDAIGTLFDQAKEGAQQAIATQGRWEITPNDDFLRAIRPGSGPLLTRRDGNPSLYIVSVPDKSIEEAMALKHPDKIGLRHAGIHVGLQPSPDGNISINFNQLIDMLQTAGAATQLTGDELIRHFGAIGDWGTSSRISPSLTAENDNLQIHIELGFGVVGDGNYQNWETSGASLQSPAHPLVNGNDKIYSFHVTLTPRELPTFDPEIIARAHHVAEHLVASFRAMQSQTYSDPVSEL